MTKSEDYKFYLVTQPWEAPGVENVEPLISYLRAGPHLSPYASKYLAEVISTLHARTQPRPAHRPEGTTRIDGDPHHIAARLAGNNLEHWRKIFGRERVPTAERDKIIERACREVEKWPVATDKPVQSDTVHKILRWPKSRRL